MSLDRTIREADRTSLQDEALDRGGARVVRPATLVSGICVLGLLLTALASWAAWRADRGTEERLLETQTRQAASVLSNAILTIQQPMQEALDIQRAVGPEAGSAAFTERFASIVGPDKLFVSASLWRLEGGRLVLQEGASVGAPPGMDPDGAEIQTVLTRALSAPTSVVESVAVGERRHIAYALADAETGFVVYAERPIPADRRAPVDRDSAYADLDYAIYLGAGPDVRPVDHRRRPGRPAPDRPHLPDVGPVRRHRPDARHHAPRTTWAAH